MTARDMQALEFISAFKLARTSTIARFYYADNLPIAQRRLSAMVEEKKVQRVKGTEYIYYTKMPKHFNHSLAVTDYLCYLSRTHEVKEMRAEYKCGNVKADALIILDGKPTFVEVQLTGRADMLKYLTLRVSKEWQDYFEVFPEVRLLSDRPPKNCGISVTTDRIKGYDFGVM